MQRTAVAAPRRDNNSQSRQNVGQTRSAQRTTSQTRKTSQNFRPSGVPNVQKQSTSNLPSSRPTNLPRPSQSQNQQNGQKNTTNTSNLSSQRINNVNNISQIHSHQSSQQVSDNKLIQNVNENNQAMSRSMYNQDFMNTRDFEAFSPWDDAQNINNPINTSNYNKSFVTNDGIQSDTFEMIQNRNFETLLNYEDHKKEEDFDSLDLVGKNNSPKLQDSKKVSSLPTVQEEQKEYEENQVQSAKKKKFNTKDMFTINTQYCRSEVELIQYVISQNGFIETSLLSQSNLVWFGLALTPKDQAMLQNKNFYYNRYPGLDVLARKKLFCSVTNRMRRTFENEFKFCPISFQLPEEAETLEAYMKKHPTFTFIAKPSSGKGGEGIVLVQKFSDIPNQSWNFKKNDLLVQRYIKTPLLLEGKKFDLRIYVLIKGYDPVEAYICEEGLARFCTQDYKPPTRENLKNMFIHLTNYSLNKNSENYKAPDEGFLEDDSGSKRLLSSLWKQLEEDGKDVAKIKEKIKDTVRKAVITIEPYLINFYQQQISQDHSTAKCFHLVGFDILLDTKLNAWLMEINSNPSFNMFLERDLPNGEVEKTISELDKYVKSKVVSEAIQIVSGKGQVDESEKLFEQVLPLDSICKNSNFIRNSNIQSKIHLPNNIQNLGGEVSCLVL